MAKTQRTPKQPDVKSLTLADVDIVWGMHKATPGVALIPALQNGGLDGLYARVRGLYDLLEGHEVIQDDSLIFVRETLHDIAERLYVSPDDRDAIAAATRCKIVVREQQPEKKAVA